MCCTALNCHEDKQLPDIIEGMLHTDLHLVVTVGCLLSDTHTHMHMDMHSKCVWVYLEVMSLVEEAFN